MTTPLAALGALQSIRDEFFSQETQELLKVKNIVHGLDAILPNWNAAWWFVLALVALIIVIIENAYKMHVRSKNDYEAKLRRHKYHDGIINNLSSLYDEAEKRLANFPTPVPAQHAADTDKFIDSAAEWIGENIGSTEKLIFLYLGADKPHHYTKELQLRIRRDNLLKLMDAVNQKKFE